MVPTFPSDADEQLVRRAREAAEHAYAPYSGIRVGAAVLTATGRIFCGCNVENASYGLAICAERSAVFAAVAAEGPSMRIKAVALVNDDARVKTPCGACRQVVAELGPNAVFLLQDGKRVTIEKLLPAAFSLG